MQYTIIALCTSVLIFFLQGKESTYNFLQHGLPPTTASYSHVWKSRGKSNIAKECAGEENLVGS